jgi:hypothetical protein
VDVLGAVALLLALLAAGRCGGVWGGWAEVLGVVSGEWRLEIAGWCAYLPVGLSRAPNDNDSVIVVVFAVLCSYVVGVCGDGERGSWEWSVVSGEWRWRGGGLTCLQGFRAP